MMKKQIPFRTDQYGLSLGLVENSRERILCTQGGSYSDNTIQSAEILLAEENNTLEITCRLNLNSALHADRLFLRLGIDCYMATYPEWNEKFFPTLIRCE